MFVWQLVRTRSDFVIARGTTLRRVKVSPVLRAFQAKCDMRTIRGL